MCCAGAGGDHGRDRGSLLHHGDDEHGHRGAPEGVRAGDPLLDGRIAPDPRGPSGSGVRRSGGGACQGSRLGRRGQDAAGSGGGRFPRPLGRAAAHPQRVALFIHLNTVGRHRRSTWSTSVVPLGENRFGLPA